MTIRLWPEVCESQLFLHRMDDGKRTIVEDLGFVMKNYPQDMLISYRADEEDRIFIIHSGWACLYTELLDGDRQIIDFPLRGDIVVPYGRRGDVAEMLCAHTPLVVLEASASKLLTELARSPRLNASFWAAITRQRAILTQHFTSVGCRRAVVRVAHFLLELAVRLEQAGVVARHGYRCPLTQYDFADALGLTAIHINRTLRELREREFVEFRHGVVRFLNRSSLERLARFDSAYLQ